MADVKKYGPLVLRIGLGVLFIIPGFMKLMNPAMIIGMLGEIGFPAAAFFGWVLLLSEIIFGISVLIGWKVRYTTWPLSIILLVAAISVWIPMLGENPMAPVVLLLHLTGIGGLVSLALSGAGAAAVDKE